MTRPIEPIIYRPALRSTDRALRPKYYYEDFCTMAERAGNAIRL
jgi:hypothetical protein